MNIEYLKQILESVAQGNTSVNNAAESLKNIAYEDIDFAHIDHHRSLRKGFPEVIFGQGKTADQITCIMDKMVKQENVILITRVDGNQADTIISKYPKAVYHDDAGIIIWKKNKIATTGKGEIVVISAGTSDIKVAKEAFLTAETMGNRVKCIFDVGIAGIHRLFAHSKAICNASVLIVAAGMEGALPGVVAGMVKTPVIAVPTSIGYGTNLGGLTPLFAMLNSCSSNIAVVNIDNGFGAGCFASSINHMHV